MVWDGRDSGWGRELHSVRQLPRLPRSGSSDVLLPVLVHTSDEICMLDFLYNARLYSHCQWCVLCVYWAIDHCIALPEQFSAYSFWPALRKWLFFYHRQIIYSFQYKKNTINLFRGGPQMEYDAWYLQFTNWTKYDAGLGNIHCKKSISKNPCKNSQSYPCKNVSSNHSDVGGMPAATPTGLWWHGMSFFITI